MRSLLDHDQQVMRREMEHIDRWRLSYLSERGLATERTFYSKRRFLRDTLTARPELLLDR
ncbi:hypothetical protein ACFU5O_27750 [Streptomyces sp. NPDC057445]|uniref:hypothetical protein n=1 Tax=Streptomyces sp. NPDC057445 TaxID=3346136 RepID=UPI0036D05C90